MKIILKFPLQLQNAQTVVMPAGAQILTVQAQNDMLHLYALCDRTGDAVEGRRFAVYGTGEGLPDEPGVYIGTTQLWYQGRLLWHVFEQQQPA